MRPLKLKMQAFGPYAKTEWIDFTELGNRTMFVIAGETGAGKTTIFDAISYAIYGVASGDDRITDDLRSHLAHPDLLTEVEFEFSLHDKIYKIIRSPKQLKKKVKTDGYTEINSKAELFILHNQEFEQIAFTLSEVDQMMRQIIGLDKEQFRQILMIPQGEFRKLLVSDSKEKERILQKLFSTHMYSKIEETLKKKNNELIESIKEHKRDENRYFSMIQAVYNETLIQYLNEEILEYHLLMPLIEEEAKKQLEHAQILKTEVKLKEDEITLVNKQHALSSELVKKFDTLQELQMELENLQKLEEHIKNQIILVDLIEKAQILQPEEEIGRNLKRTVDRISLNLEEKNKELTISNKQLENLAVQLEKHLTNQPEIDLQTVQLQKLLILKEEVENLDQLQEDVKRLKLKGKENEQNQQRLIQESTQLKESLEQIEHQLNGIQLQKNKVYQLDSQIKEDRKQLEQLLNFSKIDTEKKKTENLLINLKENLSVIDEKYKKVKDTFEQYDKNFKHSQAAILAVHLKEGDACPVCGSKEHPQLATSNMDHLNQEELERLKIQKEELELQYTNLTNQATNEQWKLDYYQSQLEEQLSPLNIVVEQLPELIKNLDESVKKQELELNKFKTIIATEDQLLTKRTNIKAQLVQVENHLQQLQPIIQETLIQLQIKTDQIKTLLEKLPESIQSLEEFTQVVYQLKQHIQLYTSKLEEIQQSIINEKERNTRLLEATVQMTKELEETNASLNEQRRLFKKKMEASGFFTKSDYLTAVASVDKKNSIKKEIEEYQIKNQSVTIRLNDLQNELQDKEKPDLIQLETKIAIAQLELEELQKQYMKLKQYLSTNEDACDKIKQIRQELHQIEKEYALIGELSDLASGKNPFKISFERYVLGYFLDRILVEANIRLNKMTNGRYELIRKTDLQKARGAAGLELLIIDQYSGRERHVRTLSGGESFKASLALALGLSDVVTQNAGGISMETIFIDEGFGTLDNESLNQAIDTLMEIQSSGRLVGIISHVDQLKENIDARLEVLTSTSGSYTKFVFSTTTT